MDCELYEKFLISMLNLVDGCDNHVFALSFASHRASCLDVFQAILLLGEKIDSWTLIRVLYTGLKSEMRCDEVS